MFPAWVVSRDATATVYHGAVGSVRPLKRRSCTRCAAKQMVMLCQGGELQREVRPKCE